MNAPNDSTQEVPSLYAGHVSFLFTDTSGRELEGSMRFLGALPKLGQWFYPGGAQPLLECTIIEDVEDYAIDLIWKAWEWYLPLFGALGVDPRNAVLLDVTVRDEPSALNVLRTFGLKLLDNHRGAVKDGNTNQVWSREEIANNSIRDGRTFFGGDVAIRPDTA